MLDYHTIKWNENDISYKGTRELHIPANLREYDIESITRIQQQEWKTTFVTRWKNGTTFSWECPGKCPNVSKKYEFWEYESDFQEMGTDMGIRRCELNVIYEQIEKDMNYEVSLFKRKKPIKKYDAKWRAEFLKEHPEYGKNGENAVKAIFALDNAEITLSQHATILNPDGTVIGADDKTSNEKPITVTDFVSGKRGVIVGRIKDIGEPYKRVRSAFLFCKWCFDCGDAEGIYDTYKVFDPPIEPQDILKHISKYEVCRRYNCGSKDLTIAEDVITICNITLVDDPYQTTLAVSGVTVFDLIKGDILAIEGEPELMNVKNGITEGLKCRRLQILQRNTGDNGILSNNLGISKDQRIRKLFFELGEKRSLTDNPIVSLSDPLTEIYNNGDNEIKSSDIFKVGHNGELDFNIGNNNALKKFRDSLSEHHIGDYGMLVRVGTTPSRFKWQPLPKSLDTNTSNKALPGN